MLVVITRGLPGSYKSTFAKDLAQEEGGVIHSTDDYFIHNGKYIFDPKKLKENHAKNLTAFIASLKARYNLVICDNTNSQHWEYAQYVVAAKQHGYQVKIVSMPHPTVDECVKRNTHGVPRPVIEAMIRRWEK